MSFKSKGTQPNDDIPSRDYARIFYDYIRVSIVTCLVQMVTNIHEYSSQTIHPPKKPYVRIFQYLFKKSEEIVIELRQGGAMSTEQWFTFFYTLSKSTAIIDFINGLGEGGRISAIALTKDMRISVVTKIDDIFKYGTFTIRDVDHKLKILYQVSYQEVDDRIKELSKNMPNDTTSFFYVFDTNKDLDKGKKISAENIGDRLLYYFNMLIENSNLDVYVEDSSTPIVSPYSGFKSEELEPTTYEKIKIEWKLKAIRDLPKHVEIKSLDSEPQILLQHIDGKHGYAQFFANGILIYDAKRISRSPLFIRVNYDFLSNFIENKKQTSDRNASMSAFIELLVSEIDKKFAENNDPSGKDIEAQIILDLADQGHERGTPFKKCLYVCSNRSCENADISKGITILLTHNPNVSPLSAEELTKIPKCEICGANYRYVPEDTEPQQEQKCPKCFTKDINTVREDISTLLTIFYYTCKNCSHKWNKKVTHKGNWTHQLTSSTKWIDVDFFNKIIFEGTESKVRIKYKLSDKKTSFLMKQGVLSAPFSLITKYDKEDRKTDGDGSLWGVKRVEIDNMEELLLKNPKSKYETDATVDGLFSE